MELQLSIYGNKRSIMKKAFSLIEVSIFLIITALMLAALAPLISKRYKLMKSMATHGVYTCFYNGSQLVQQTYKDGKLKKSENVSSCTFKPPKKALYFVVDIIGAGGAGGKLNGSATATQVSNQTNLSSVINEYGNSVSYPFTTSDYILKIAYPTTSSLSSDLEISESQVQLAWKDLVDSVNLKIAPITKRGGSGSTYRYYIKKDWVCESNGTIISDYSNKTDCEAAHYT